MDFPKKGMSSEGDQVSAPAPSPHSSTSSNSEGNKKKRQPTGIAEDDLANKRGSPSSLNFHKADFVPQVNLKTNQSPSFKAVKSLIVGPEPLTTLISERLLKTEVLTGENVFLEKNYTVQITPEYFREIRKNPPKLLQKLRQDGTRYIIWLVHCDGKYPMKEFVEDVNSLGELVNSRDDLESDIYLCMTSSNLAKNYHSVNYFVSAPTNPEIRFKVLFVDVQEQFQKLMGQCIQRMKRLALGSE